MFFVLLSSVIGLIYLKNRIRKKILIFWQFLISKLKFWKCTYMYVKCLEKYRLEQLEYFHFRLIFCGKNIFSVTVNSYNRDGKLVIRNQVVTFAVGAGGFGGPRTGTKVVPCLKKPNRKPDVSLTQQTSIDQAALYRLCGK